MSQYHWINTSETGWTSPDRQGGGSSVLSSMLSNWFDGGIGSGQVIQLNPIVSGGGVVPVKGASETNCNCLHGEPTIDENGNCICKDKADSTIKPMPQTIAPAINSQNALQAFVEANPVLTIGAALVVAYFIFGKK